MRRMSAFCIIVFAVSLFEESHAEDVRITPDVVYGHKFGMAMTFDVFTPAAKPNGAAVLFMVSGGWNSHWTPPEHFQARMQPLTDRGFTVFAVRHGSSPKFSIAEAVADVRRSVRFIRLNAKQFEIAPDRIGVFGISAGGHLSLMLGTTSDEGDPQAKDPVLRVSDRVQAVVAFVAPTDLRVAAKDAPNRLPAYAGFPALNIDQKTAAVDSPLLHVTPDDAPALLLAGAKDPLVPVFHSRNIQTAFKKSGVTSRLIEFPEAGHGFDGEDLEKAAAAMVAWFEHHLRAD